MDTVVRNIQILSEGRWVPADLALEGGKFAEVGGSVSGSFEKEIDAGGAYCLPGGVDLHVHFNDPGRSDWEGFASGSAAAALGGTTYLADMPLNCLPPTTTVEALQTKLGAIRGRAWVDYGLWGGLVPENVDQLEALAEAGVMGFKAFMSPSGIDEFNNSDAVILRRGMRRIAQTGLRLALHAEDPTVLRETAGQLSSRETAVDWEASRPVEAEISAVKIAIEIAVETGCPITIVHVSAPEVLNVIDAAKADGADIVCETCPHYLLLSLEDSISLGPVAKCAPPLRRQLTATALWEAVLAGRIDTIGSDHSPSPPEMKDGKIYYEAWGGISGVQHGLPLVLSKAGLGDAVALSLLMDLFSKRPAALTGLESKGQVATGFDADFFLVRDLAEPQAIRQTELLYRHSNSPYVGKYLSLRAVSTWLRGQCIVGQGQLVGESVGQFIAGKAYNL